MVATLEKVFIDPYEAEKKLVRRLYLYWFLCLPLSLALIGGTVMVTVKSGAASRQAFEQLPRYRMGRLLVDYNRAVKTFNQSEEQTQALLNSDAAARVLSNARTLPELVLNGEHAFAETIALYSDITETIVFNSGATLEWNRHFQSQLEGLIQASEQRQQTLSSLVESYPQPAHSPAEDSTTEQPDSTASDPPSAIPNSKP